MAATTAEGLGEIDAIHKRRPNYGHPLWRGMVEGTHNLEQVRYFCKQHSIITLHNHNYHGRLYVACPDPEWRERIAEVSYEEATGRLFADGVSHHKLYLNYAKGLGLGREEMYNVDYCAGALAFKAYFSDACSRFVEGVAAHMLAGEAQIPGLLRPHRRPAAREVRARRARRSTTGMSMTRPTRTIPTPDASCSTASPRPTPTGRWCCTRCARPSMSCSSCTTTSGAT